jgi:RNA-directed DNA polymerase
VKPLSPLLANVLLDVVDQALERRGHRFVRYADDCNVYVRSKRAAERVMEGLAAFYAQLKLRVKPAKNAAAPVWQRSFLGYRFWMRTLVEDGDARRVADRLSDPVSHLTRRAASWSLVTSTHRTAGCGPARPVVWEGSRRAILSYFLSRSDAVARNAS